LGLLITRKSLQLRFNFIYLLVVLLNRRSVTDITESRLQCVCPWAWFHPAWWARACACTGSHYVHQDNGLSVRNVEKVSPYREASRVEEQDRKRRRPTLCFCTVVQCLLCSLRLWYFYFGR